MTQTRARQGPFTIDGGRLGGFLFLALLLALVAAPILYVIYGSLRTGAPGATDAGFTLENWRTVYLSAPYLKALWNTLALSAIVSVLALLLGGALAWLVGRTDMPGRNQMALLLVVPLLISNLITTLAWIALAAPNAGFLNAWFRSMTGVRTLFDIYSFQGVVLVHVLHFASFAYLALFAALRSIDASLEEASYMLGVGPVRTGLRMTLPLIAPTLATSFLIIFVLVAENFSVPTLLGSPVGFHTLPSLIYQNMAVTPAHPTLAAAAGTMLLWVALIGAAIQRRVTRNASRYVTVTGKGNRFRLVRLGRWRFAALGFVALYLFLAVVLPYFALMLGSFMSFLTANIRPGVFTLENYATILVGDNLEPVLNSLLLSAGGGLALTILYLGMSFFLEQTSKGFARLVDYVTMLPSAIPALILGVGLIWTFVGWSVPIYGTMAILLIAYFLRNLGYGLRQANNAFSQIARELTEAARMTGASRLRALWDISIPLIRPAILSLWTMLFIFIFMEVSATILLYTPDTRTMPTVLWNYMSSGSQPHAFAIAVAQATLVFIVLYLADRRFGLLRKTLER
jgi:iron(III) transport system permease protein